MTQTLKIAMIMACGLSMACQAVEPAKTAKADDTTAKGTKVASQKKAETPAKPKLLPRKKRWCSTRRIRRPASDMPS